MKQEDLKIGNKYYVIKFYDDGYIIFTGRLEALSFEMCGFRKLNFIYWTTGHLAINDERNGWRSIYNTSRVKFVDSITADITEVYDFEDDETAKLFAEVNI